MARTAVTKAAGMTSGPAFHINAREFFTTQRPSREQRRAQGLEQRTKTPVADLGRLPDPGSRRDALQILHAQDAARIPELVPLRYERMSANAFAFLRGSAAVMASDLSLVPTSGIRVQLCGDAHIANFGMFASPERTLVFDVNDFDETLPGPFDWDVRRLVASAAVAARESGFSDKKARRVAREAASVYRQVIAILADQDTLDVWNVQLGVDEVLAQLRKGPVRSAFEQARKRAAKGTSARATAKLTAQVDGQRRFVSDPPLVHTVPDDIRPMVVEKLARAYESYLRTIQPDRAALLSLYSFVDVAQKVVGVGSVGTLAPVMLLESGDGEPLILQMKQAGASVLEPYLGASKFTAHGERVAVGQRVMQASSDPFLGYLHADDNGERVDMYIRQLKDMKGSVDIGALDATSLAQYSGVCAASLARAHARVGDSAMIASYLGDSDEFDEAMADFAIGYADINQADFGALLAERTPQQPTTT